MLDTEAGSIDVVGARVIVALQYCKGLCHLSMYIDQEGSAHTRRLQCYICLDFDLYVLNTSKAARTSA